MKHNFQIILLFVLSTIMMGACVSKKKKGEVGKVGKFYHNMTSKYNGYFNANELMEASYATLESSHKDNYSQLLPVFPYIETSSAKAISPDMDIVIEKVTKVAIVHEPGDYVDDCYVMMGQAQFLKQDYETAEETFVYFQEEFNPSNPFGKGYKKKSKKARQKEREAEQKRRKKEQEEKKQARKEKKEEQDKEREELAEKKKKEREAKAKARKEERERIKKEKEQAKKNRKKKGKKGSKKRPKKETTKQTTAIDTSASKVISTPLPKTSVEKKEEEIEEEEEVKPKKKKPEAKDETAYSEGLLWLAKTYIERENYSSADYILKTLEKKNVQDHVRREVAPTLAHLYISQKKYQNAIPYLDEAIETADDKSLKARYAYIIGQIYQRAGLRSEASIAFERVNKYKPSFDMKFNSKLAALKNAARTGIKSIDSVEDELEDMLGDNKYNEYNDQIYFTLAEIHLDQGKTDLAVTEFSKSLQRNINNDPLKAEAYYLLGELYFGTDDFVEAKNYYDSTLTVMVKEDDRYPKVEKLAANLTDIASNINTITLQDSLLVLSAMSKEEQAEVAKLLIESQPVKEVADNDKASKSGQGRKSNLDKFTGKDMFGTSDKWPYDLRKVQKGKATFKKKWGEIELVDNWRRSSSLNSSYAGLEASGENELEDEEEKVEVSDKQIKETLKAVPKNPNDIVDANKKIQKAMYDLGVLYRSKINNYEQSIASLEGLIKRYPDTQYKLDAYYNLYLANLDLNDAARAKYYLGKINSEFGESTIAKTLNDPEYGKKIMNDQQKILAYYEETYELFSKGKFDKVSDRIKVVDNSFTFEHNLKPKFALLNAMSLGKLNGKEAYIASLTDMVTRYPDTPESTRGKEILRFLKGDGEAFNQLDIKEVDNIFSQEDDRRHYLMLVTFEKESDKFTNAKIGISKYNKKYHKLEKLQLNHSTLDQEKNSRIILVRQFKNKTKAVKYYEEVVKNKEEFVGDVDLEYEVFAVTQANYRKIVAARSVNTYRVFHDTYYKSK